MPRFVILRHMVPADFGRQSHWDLMLEDVGVLKTWALEQPPVIGSVTLADQLPDHRLAYLDYEGPISGNRGYVETWDTGMHEWCTRHESIIVTKLFGNRLFARVTLTRNPQDQRWCLRCADMADTTN